MEGLEPPRDLVLETSALPIELHTCIFFEVSIGFEPIYRDFADLDLTSRTTDLVVVSRMRFELTTSGV